MTSAVPTLEAAHGRVLYRSFKVKNVASDGCLQRMVVSEPVFLKRFKLSTEVGLFGPLPGLGLAGGAR